MKYTALAFLIFLQTPAHALKLELTAGVDAQMRSYQNIASPTGEKNLSYYYDNSYINFVIKQIVLEKSEDSKMDVFIGLKNIDVDRTSSTLNSPLLQENYNFYPEINRPFVNQAYARIYNFYRENITASFGRQSYTLGQGIVLSDSGRGFNGVKLEFKDYLKIDQSEAFIFRDALNENIYKIYGLTLMESGLDGTWQAYFFTQDVSAEKQEISFDAKDSKKNFAGIRYYTAKNQLSFDGEYILQTGSAKDSNTLKKVDYKGYAFLLKGQWKQRMPLLGPTRTRLSYGKSSGNSRAVSGQDKAFYADLGYRYNGVSREGFGSIFAASLYDVFKTSPTLNGLPDGISGLNIIDFGFDYPHNERLMLSFDYLGFRAAENTVRPGTLKIGTEMDFKAEYKLGEKLSLFAVYSIFTPDSALGSSLKKTKMTSLSVKAKF